MCLILNVSMRLHELYISNNKSVVITAHPWCDDHSTSISACGVQGGKNRDLSL